MKTVGIRDLQAHIGTVMTDADKEPVVVLRHGRPVAVIFGLGNEDLARLEHKLTKLLISLNKKR